MKRLSPLLAGVLLLLAYSARATDDPRYLSVQALGALNGIALQCKYIDQVRRMKSAVVATAPKERSFGLAFDQATNDAYLVAIRSGQACPGPAGFATQVDESIQAMQRAFSTE